MRALLLHEWLDNVSGPGMLDYPVPCNTAHTSVPTEVSLSVGPQQMDRKDGVPSGKRQGKAGVRTSSRVMEGSSSSTLTQLM